MRKLMHIDYVTMIIELVGAAPMVHITELFFGINVVKY